jgi:hypothetical protein
MPNASRACSIALMIAAAAGITPHSPPPLTPSRLSGEGETWLISSIRESKPPPVRCGRDLNLDARRTQSCLGYAYDRTLLMR